MQNLKPHDQIQLLLGKLMENFLELELVVRLFLHVCDQKNTGKSYSAVNHLKLNEGDTVDLSFMTNEQTLSELIQKYNKIVSRLSHDLLLHEKLITLRNAIAHGRLLSQTNSSPPRLVNFGHTKKEKVKVLYVADLTEQWLKEQLGFTHSAFLKVIKANKMLGEVTIEPV